MTRSIDLFRNRHFSLYWFAALISALGDAIFLIALNWMVVASTGSGAVLGTVMMAMALAQILLTMFGGVLVDRADPRRVMMAGDLVNAVLMCFLLCFGLGGTGAPPLWSLYVAAVGLGAVNAFYWPAYAAFRQRVVTEEQYTASNSLLMIPGQAAAIVGPLLGGVLVAGGHTQVVLLVNGISFLLSFLCLWFVRLQADERLAARAETAAAGPRSMKQDLLEGVRFVFRSPLLIATSLSAFVVNFCVQAALLGLPFLAQASGKGALGFGQLNMGFGIGGAVGALVFAVLMIKNPTPSKTLLACLVEGVLFLLLGAHGPFVLAIVLMALIGVTETAINIIAPSVNQLIIPKELMGRVIGFMILLMSGSEPLAKALGGLMLDHTGPTTLFLSGGGLEVLTAVVAFFLPAIRLYGKRTQPLER